MNLPLDFKELLEEFVRDGVDFLLVGGYAVAYHGRPRSTKDIDLLLDGRAVNLRRAARALARFGAPENVISAVRSLKENDVVFMGQAPLRVDLMRSIDGVDPKAVFRQAEATELDGVPCRVISLDHLIANKRASGRPQDLIDATFLEKVRARTGNRKATRARKKK